MDTRYIFVTGGVTSSLGKGITAASLGRLLKARGYTVAIQKFDPYLHIDPGTMNPYQHGEVFVTEDGAETDLDLGHYERFVDENLVNAELAQQNVLPSGVLIFRADTDVAYFQICHSVHCNRVTLHSAIFQKP